MTMTTDINHPHGEPDPALDARAAASLSALFEARRSLTTDLERAGRAHTHLEQERQREADALQAQNTAEQHAAGVAARLDPAGQRFAWFTAGAVVVTNVVDPANPVIVFDSTDPAHPYQPVRSLFVNFSRVPTNAGYAPMLAVLITVSVSLKRIAST